MNSISYSHQSHPLPNYVGSSDLVESERRGEKKLFAPNCISIWKAEICRVKKKELKNKKIKRYSSVKLLLIRGIFALRYQIARRHIAQAHTV